MNDFKYNFYLAAQSSTFWLVFFIAYVVLGLFSAGHALLHKRDSRSALGWVVACLVLPIAGSVAYLLFGINRIKSKAKQLSKEMLLKEAQVDLSSVALKKKHKAKYLMTIAETITPGLLTNNNQWQCLRNGEQAFPAMLKAINEAKHQVLLSTYIFGNDATGQAFNGALKAAHERGVSLYVLIDGIGARYSVPSMLKTLKRSGIRCAAFLPPRWFPPQISINLRNHRKILVVDQRVAFTGGINITHKHCVSAVKNGAADLHFSFTGGVVEQLSELFWRDWQLATGEFSKMLERSPAEIEAQGYCRLIADGPDGDLDKLSLTLNAVISAAKEHVILMTPYFIPSKGMIAVMLSAVQKGVTVEVLLPAKSNLWYVDWATQHMMGELINWGVKIYRKPAPFEHSKLVVVDDCYVMVGSANIDPRSLRLNFELMVEVFDQPFCEEMSRLTHELKHQSELVTIGDILKRPLWQKLRDGFFWLFSPYL
ncbi:cardiolipin synthase [Marinicella rhabdoformis]|uniref:cardiolipin synthase n=1 Tax=Marinicella rhabdoformis TaxID=2580566 RepID=UPI0012AED997|nr:cardiolipin synthase [Marinicella rhabdoformis]